MPYVGEIRMFAGNFAPQGWMLCQGQLLAITENEALFNLIGTTYGGDGQSTFALPDYRGRAVMHQGNGYVLGQMVGVEQVTLTTTQIPAHNHPLIATTVLASGTNPTNDLLAQSSGLDLYNLDPPDVATAASNISSTGGSQPHNNMQPYLAINYIISMFGTFPSPT